MRLIMSAIIRRVIAQNAERTAPFLGSGKALVDFLQRHRQVRRIIAPPHPRRHHGDTDYAAHPRFTSKSGQIISRHPKQHPHGLSKRIKQLQPQKRIAPGCGFKVGHLRPVWRVDLEPVHQRFHDLVADWHLTGIFDIGQAFQHGLAIKPGKLMQDQG